MPSSRLSCSVSPRSTSPATSAALCTSTCPLPWRRPRSTCSLTETQSYQPWGDHWDYSWGSHACLLCCCCGRRPRHSVKSDNKLKLTHRLLLWRRRRRGDDWDWEGDEDGVSLEVGGLALLGERVGRVNGASQAGKRKKESELIDGTD